MKTPFLILAAALSSGIILSDLFGLTLFHFGIYTILLLLFSLVYQYYSKQLFKPTIQTALLVLICISAGVSIRSVQLQQRLSGATKIQQEPCAKVVLTEYKGTRGKSELWRGRFENRNTLPSSFYVHLYLDSANTFQENQILLIPIDTNAWEFCSEEENSWMLKSNIIAQAFPKHFIVSKEKYLPGIIMKWSEDLQQYTINVLREHIRDQDAGAIAISMILGQRTEISSDLQNAYKNTGTIHILAVSGMHVALLHQALIVLTAFSGNNRKIKITKNIVSLFILWFYALLTGFSASVVRAAAMFSLVLIASSLEKKDKGFNNLCAASFILLCYDPCWLYDFGFLLSVSAVAGIYLFAPAAPSAETSAWKKFIRNATGISIAAQAGTLPISLYLSRNFPLYFLPANLILIPVSSLALYLGLALLITHHIPLLNFINGWLLEYTLIGMNHIATFIAQLPGGLIHLYHFNTTSACWLGVILISLAIYLQYKKKLLIFTTLILIAGFMLSLIAQELNTTFIPPVAVKKYHQDQPVVSMVKGRTLFIKHKGNEPPAYNWLNRKLNLEDGVITRVVYLPDTEH